MTLYIFYEGVQNNSPHFIGDWRQSKVHMRFPTKNNFENFFI